MTPSDRPSGVYPRARLELDEDTLHLLRVLYGLRSEARTLTAAAAIVLLGAIIEDMESGLGVCACHVALLLVARKLCAGRPSANLCALAAYEIERAPVGVTSTQRAAS